MNCTNCGTVLNPNDLFCRQCGHPVTEKTNTSQTQTIQNQYANSYNNNQPKQQYNNYNNASNSSNIGKIVLIIILAIIFWFTGWSLGKIVLVKNNTNNNYITTSKKTNYIFTNNRIKVLSNVDNTLKENTNSNNEKHICRKNVNENKDLTVCVEKNILQQIYYKI